MYREIVIEKKPNKNDYAKFFCASACGERLKHGNLLKWVNRDAPSSAGFLCEIISYTSAPIYSRRLCDFYFLG